MAKKRTIVLAGGGHTHALLLKKIQQSPLHNTHIVLLSTTRYTPYSGMLPGVISGHYTAEQAHIDLQQLAWDSGCDFIEGSVRQANPDTQTITTNTSETISYDILSINTGSTQSRLVEADHCLRIKPVHQFFHWLYREFPERLNTYSTPFELVVVGAGAAGIEVAIALKHRYKNKGVNVHIASGGSILPGYPASIQRSVLNELDKKNILIHRNFRATSVEAQHLISGSGEQLHYDQLILATPASPDLWPSESQLTTDVHGFIVVNDCLQSLSHPNVFAVGDVATRASKELPKCGVMAVRQAPTLYANLRNSLSGAPLIPFRPQQHFLALLSCADGRAIASRGSFRAKGRLVWYWKDWIDKKFMHQFPLPEPGSFDYL
ncbi:hypothetical protein ACH42_13125 [Endozoicomonas sp. (ex Bugula neritina AB1)]|nr:hypothetical protein ACH42_13125 [Endozoicomonas sp. (ex Bugula neritina AB1)]